MKTKLVQHVPRINLSHFKFSNFLIFSGSQLLSDFQTFFSNMSLVDGLADFSLSSLPEVEVVADQPGDEDDRYGAEYGGQDDLHERVPGAAVTVAVALLALQHAVDPSGGGGGDAGLAGGGEEVGEEEQEKEDGWVGGGRHPCWLPGD